jgi:hypothetical protein
MSRRDDQIAAFRAGDLRTEARVMTEPVEVADEVKVGRSLRLPVSVFGELSAYAQARGVPWSSLAREWIVAGLAAAKAAEGIEPDPAADLREILDKARHALTALSRQAA